MTLTNEDLKALSDLLEEKLEEKLHKRLNPINSRLEGIEGRLDKLEADVESLKVGQMEIKKELYMMDRRISDTYKVALDAWGQGIENRKLFTDAMQYQTAV